MEDRLLEIEESRDETGTLRVRLRGELDMSTVPLLRDRLKDASDRNESVVLDLDELDFVDSSGLRLLIAARLGVRRQSWSVEFSKPSRAVRRIFEVAGLDGRLFFER